ELARGRLMSDIDLSGFDALTGGPALPAKRAKARPKRATEDPRELEQVQQLVAKRHAITRARAKLTSAREHEKTLARRLREVEREERAARVGYERAGRTAERVRGDHQAALAAVDAARAKLEETRRPSPTR